MQSVSITCSKSVYKVVTSLIFTHLLQLNEDNRLAETCRKPVKATTCSKFITFLAVYYPQPTFVQLINYVTNLAL